MRSSFCYSPRTHESNDDKTNPSPPERHWPCTDSPTSEETGCQPLHLPGEVKIPLVLLVSHEILQGLIFVGLLQWVRFALHSDHLAPERSGEPAGLFEAGAQ